MKENIKKALEKQKFGVLDLMQLYLKQYPQLPHKDLRTFLEGCMQIHYTLDMLKENIESE